MSEQEHIRIESLAYTGAGVAHLADGRVVFVSGAIPGDLVTPRILREHSRFLHAEVDTLVEASPQRVAPPCPYHELCGACDFQHLAYPEQLEWKRRFVVDALERIGALGDADALVQNTIASPAPWGYRNKVELESHWQKNRLTLGFHAKGNTGIVPVERCLLLPQGSEEFPAALAGALGYALKSDSEDLSRVGVRVSRVTGDVELALWMEAGACNRAFVTRVLKDAIAPTSLVRVLTAGPAGKRQVKKVEVLSGHGHWRERLCGFCFRISAPSFFQVNTAAASLLVERVLADIEADGASVADLYSGAGTFTLPLARRARRLVAVELAGSSIRDLRRNLSENDCEAEVLGGDVERILPTLDGFERMLIDPPRAGLSPGTLRAIADAAPQTLIYVSCNPSTLARDVKDLAERGYRLTSATPVDLFPQTWHVETVAKLSRQPHSRPHGPAAPV
jgi:23S rRNA (uracil1939-C5)-methyltransferase